MKYLSSQGKESECDSLSSDERKGNSPNLLHGFLNNKHTGVVQGGLYGKIFFLLYRGAKVYSFESK